MSNTNVLISRKLSIWYYDSLEEALKTKESSNFYFLSKDNTEERGQVIYRDKTYFCNLPTKTFKTSSKEELYEKLSIYLDKCAQLQENINHNETRNRHIKSISSESLLHRLPPEKRRKVLELDKEITSGLAFWSSKPIQALPLTWALGLWLAGSFITSGITSFWIYLISLVILVSWGEVIWRKILRYRVLKERISKLVDRT